MQSSSRLVGLALTSLFLGLSGCGSQHSADERPTAKNVEVESGECHAASDCDSGQICAVDEGSAARRSLLIIAPCMTPVFVSCTTDAVCGEGQICTQEKDPVPVNASGGVCPASRPTSVCAPACSETTCPLGTRCEEDGHCRLIPCDDAEGMCPDGFFCDSETAGLGLEATDVTVAGGLTVVGVDLVLSAPMVDLHRTGCLLLHCDEAGGPSCLPGYVCDRALAEDSSVGCAVLDCHDWGQCSSDTYVCDPTSSNPRPAGMDAHGCSLKNCEEGFDCGSLRVCDFNRPDADEWGCGFVQCDEAGATQCPKGYSCKPGHEYASSAGCAPLDCTEGYECAATATCDPGAPNADVYGCVVPVAPAPTGTAPSDPVPSPTTPSPNDGAGGATNPSGPAAPPNPEPAGAGNSTSSNGGAPSDEDAVGPVPEVRPEGKPQGGACVDDVDCQTGYCVNQTCSSSLGQCQ